MPGRLPHASPRSDFRRFVEADRLAHGEGTTGVRVVEAELADRLWPKVLTGPGCWEWQGKRDKDGYGLIYVPWSNTGLRAHRVAWELANGPIPEGQFVLHHCDNPPCAKTEADEQYPAGHLFLGTRGDNIRDARDKGRSRAPVLSGEANPAARLTVIAVRAIRAAIGTGATVSEIARRFEVSRRTIRDIRDGRKWRDA